MTGTATIRYTAKAIPWQAPLFATALSTIMVVTSHGPPTVFPLQASSILLAAGAGFAFDDPSFELLAPSTTSMLKRRAARLLIVLPPTVATWAGLVMWHGTNGPDEAWTLLTMFAGLLGLGLAIAGIACRRTAGRGGAIAAPTMLAALIVSSILPADWRPLPLGDVPGGWTALQARWATTATIGTLVLLASSRDPAKAWPSRNRGRPVRSVGPASLPSRDLP